MRDPEQPRVGLLRRALLGLFVLVFLLATGLSIWHDYRQSLASAEQQSQNLAHTLDEHISRTFLAVDQIVRFLRAMYALDPVRFDLLEGRLAAIARHDAIRQLTIIDATGRIGTATAGAGIETLDIRDRDYFRFHAVGHSDTLYISAPVETGGAGRWTIRLSRRLNNADGTFGGVILVALDPTYFTRFFQSINLGLDGRFTIVSNDGHILASEPFMPSAMGQDMSRTKMLLEMVPSAPVGTYTSAEAPDSMLRIVSYRQLSDLPLIVALGVSQAEVLAKWRIESWLKAGGALIVVLLAWALLTLLRREVARLQVMQAIIATALDCVVVADHRGRITEFNPAAERVFGYRRSDVLGRDLAEILLPPKPRAVFAQLLAAGSSELLGRRTEVTAMRSDGQEFAAELAIASTWSTDGALVFTAYLRDVTEQKQLEAQLLQSQKMDALGQLAGGVAHDFNNILSVIGGYAGLATRRLDAPDADVPASRHEIRDCLAHIVKGVQRASALTREMLAFSRKKMLGTKVVDLASLIRNQHFLLKPLLGEVVELQIECPDDPVYARVDPDVLAQAIVNLAINARDAMPSGGVLRVGMETLEASDQLPSMAEKRAYARLAIADQGTGMDAATLRHIFEPFFTTKPVGAGTGLGLSMVYGAIKQAGGVIDVRSEPGAGTTFDLYIPRIEPTADELPRDQGFNGGAATPPARILIAEDEPDLRNLVARVLEDAGHTVRAAGNGVEALEAFEAESYDLLMTDIVMPELGGLKLAALLGEADPELKIIYMTGYPSRGRYLAGDIPRDATVIFKPIDPEIMLRTVSDVLAAPRPIPAAA